MKTIRLKDSYRGKRTQERVIPAGDYAEDDKRLFGIADYLIENGHAVRINKDGKPATVTTAAGGDVQFFTNVTGEPVPVVIGDNPDLTPAEKQEIIHRYQLALELKAKADTALEAERNTGDDTPQGDDMYHLRTPLSTALGGDLVTVPGKGIVPDVTLPRAVWEMGKDVVFPVDVPVANISHLEDLDDDMEATTRGRWQDSDEYRTLARDREIALERAGEDTNRLNVVQSDFDRQMKDAESKWNETDVRPVSKPKSKTIKSK